MARPLDDQVPDRRHRRTDLVSHLLWILPLSGATLSVASLAVMTALVHLRSALTGTPTLFLVGQMAGPGWFAVAWNAAAVWLLVVAAWGLVGMVSKTLPLRASIPSLVGGGALGALGLFVGLFLALIGLSYSGGFTTLSELDRPPSDQVVVEQYPRFGEHVIWHGGPILYDHVAVFFCDHHDPVPSPCYEIEQGPNGDVLITPDERIHLPSSALRP